MIKFFKQLFCSHRTINIKTESDIKSSLLIVMSHITCAYCEKAFPSHPNAECCYVRHLHSSIIYEKFCEEYRRIRNSQCQV
jgi:hypothetical protein